MLSTNMLRYGNEAPLPAQRVLHAGPLSLIYEAGDLRYIRLGEHEVVRRIYVAVRDRNWDTIPAALTNERIETGLDWFHITYDAAHRQRDVDFAWHGEIVGERDGTLRFHMDGRAGSTFLRNRIGFCVLHPAACAGAACRIEHVDSTVEGAAFPRFIAPQTVENGRIHPHYPFAELRALSHEIASGTWANVRFTGEIFELEDQRNWTDGSFKTYSTPLRLPYPALIDAKTRVQQTVTLTLEGHTAAEAQRADSGETISFVAQPTPAPPLPRIGLGVASHGQPLSETELARLQALRPAHLRVDLRLDAPQYVQDLERAAAESRALGAPLEVALFVSDDAEAELRAVRRAFDRVRPSVVAWLIFHSAEKTTAAGWVGLARAQLASYAPEAVFASGTNVYFTDLNCARPQAADFDALTYSVNPQVHAFDNASLAETPALIGTTVASARQFSANKPIVISPITLKPRFNPSASEPAPAPALDELPPQVDARQMSLFGACWTLATLKYVAESGLLSATYYETSGWRGVLESDAGSPLPARFPSLPGAVFPLYHVLADVNAYAGGVVLPTRSSAPLAVESLAIHGPDATRLLLANMTNAPQLARVQLPAGTARLRMLDEHAAEAAMRDPEAFRARMGTPVQPSDGTLELRLLPYAVACIDVQA